MCAARSVMDGYFDNPEATAATLEPDGWLHTGDLVRQDIGRLLLRRRPREGSHHQRRLQHLSGRGRARDRAASRRRDGCGRGDARRGARARRRRRSSCRASARAARPPRSSSTAGRSSPPTRSRGPSSSSTTCRRRAPARSCAACSRNQRFKIYPEKTMVDFNSGYQMTIDGRAAPTTRTFDAYNPATRAVIAAVPDATREQLDLAVASARRAFGTWSTSSFETRQSALARDRRGAREARRGLHGAADEGTRQAARRRGMGDRRFGDLVSRDREAEARRTRSSRTPPSVGSSRASRRSASSAASCRGTSRCCSPSGRSRRR